MNKPALSPKKTIKPKVAVRIWESGFRKSDAYAITVTERSVPEMFLPAASAGPLVCRRDPKTILSAPSDTKEKPETPTFSLSSFSAREVKSVTDVPIFIDEVLLRRCG